MNGQENISERAVVETVTRYVGKDVAVTDDLSDDIGLDSIDRLNLMTTVEQEHGVHLSDDEIASISNLRDLLRLLNAVAGEGEGNPEADA
jgi:acyl carrier protein